MRSVPSVRLPAELVRGPEKLPAHCSRHGRPAVRQADFSLRVKRAPGRLPVKGWPLCPRCVRSRTVWLAVTLALFFGGLVSFFSALAVRIAIDNPPENAPAIIAVIAFIVMLLAWLPSYLSGYPRLTRANPSPDGASVIVVSPSEEFRSDLHGQRRV